MAAEAGRWRRSAGGTASLIPPRSLGSLPASVIAGQKAAVSQTVTITDSGAAYGAPATTAFFLATGTTTDANSIQLPGSITKTLKLKVGGHTAYKLNLKSIPASVPNGTYHVITQVTDNAGNVTEAASTGTITVAPPQIDLSATIGKFTATARAGKKFVETITVANTAGNTAAVGSLAIEVDTSPDSNPANGTVLTTLTKKINLKPGKTLNVALSLLAPATGSPFFLVFKLDPENAFQDINLANNVVVSSLRGLRSPHSPLTRVLHAGVLDAGNDPPQFLAAPDTPPHPPPRRTRPRYGVRCLSGRGETPTPASAPLDSPRPRMRSTLNCLLLNPSRPPRADPPPGIPPSQL